MSTDHARLGWTDEMMRLAETWPVYRSTSTYGPVQDVLGRVIPAVTLDVVRCVDCDCVIPVGETPHRAQHLVLYHGYRMDGRREGDLEPPRKDQETNEDDEGNIVRGTD